MTALMKPDQALLMVTLALAAGCSNGQASSSQGNRVPEASAPSVRLVGRVTDAAHVLTAEQEARLSMKLDILERETKHQMVVTTVPTLGGEDVGTFTTEFANTWGVGRKGYDDGVVLLIAPTERRARIAVGYGLQKELPDALCQQIMDQHIIPHFRTGDLAGGIEAGVDALVAKLAA